MMQWKRVARLWLVLAALGVMPAVAQDAVRFDRHGVIDAVALGQQRLVIFDVTYHFPASTPVYRSTPQRDEEEAGMLVDQRLLRPGMRVGYSVSPSRDAAGQQQLTVVWILPRHGRR